MTHCTSCGATVEKGMKKCPNCGKERTVNTARIHAKLAFIPLISFMAAGAASSIIGFLGYAIAPVLTYGLYKGDEQILNYYGDTKLVLHAFGITFFWIIAGPLLLLSALLQTIS